MSDTIMVALSNTPRTATIDAADAALVAGRSYYLHVNGYARASRSRTGQPYLHQVVARAMGIVGRVDHVNRDRLDCRRANLRAATAQENALNRSPRSCRASQLKGITRDRSTRWRAQIAYQRQWFGLGTYDTEEEAARAYDSAAAFLFGQFGSTNFPDPIPRSPEEIAAAARPAPKHGRVGLSWSAKRQQWRAYRMDGRRFVHLGWFEERSAAEAALP